MEANVCDINHLDADVLLPPRKRLLAGLKKQNSDGNSHVASPSSATSEFDICLNNFLRSRLNKPNLSPEEIIEASRSAALGAVKVAEAARAAAEEKAARAAKAVVAAKNALELVATVSSSDERACKERHLRKNKLKKHVPVQMLYNKQKGIENCKTDEELARRLHRAMNSSPRISKNSSTSDSKSKHKRLKASSSFEKSRVYNGRVVPESNLPSMTNANGAASEVDSEGSNQEGHNVKVDESTSKLSKVDHLKMAKGDAEALNSKEKLGEASEEDCNSGRKRGRMKQKKLPLSICNFRDKANPKEELKSTNTPLTEENTSIETVDNKPLFSVGPSVDGVVPVERTSMWKCQGFRAPQCVKQNKVMQS